MSQRHPLVNTEPVDAFCAFPGPDKRPREITHGRPRLRQHGHRQGAEKTQRLFAEGEAAHPYDTLGPTGTIPVRFALARGRVCSPSPDITAVRIAPRQLVVSAVLAVVMAQKAKRGARRRKSGFSPTDATQRGEIVEEIVDWLRPWKQNENIPEARENATQAEFPATDEPRRGGGARDRLAEGPVGRGLRRGLLGLARGGASAPT
jgi:hypothetical protein